MDRASFTWVMCLTPHPEEQAGRTPTGLYPGPTWMWGPSALPGGPLSLVRMGKSASGVWPSAHRRLELWQKDGASSSPCG